MLFWGPRENRDAEGVREGEEEEERERRDGVAVEGSGEGGRVWEQQQTSR